MLTLVNQLVWAVGIKYISFILGRSPNLMIQHNVYKNTCDMLSGLHCIGLHVCIEASDVIICVYKFFNNLELVYIKLN